MVSKPYVVLVLAIPACLDAPHDMGRLLAACSGRWPPVLKLLPKLVSELIQASAAVHVRSRHPQ